MTTQLGGVAPAGLEEPSDITRLSDLGLTNGPGEPTLVELDQASERCRSGLDQALEAARERAEAAFVRAHHPALVAHRESLIADHERFGLSVAELW